MPAPRRFDHDECRRLRAADRKYWTIKRLAGHYGVGVRAIERALNPDTASAYQRRRYWEDKAKINAAQARWRAAHRTAHLLARKCCITMAEARAILAREARP
jgi:hypothetical protein